MRSKTNKKAPYVGKRSARVSFIAGVGACLMLVAATACVAIAVLIMLDYRLPVLGGIIPTGSAVPAFGSPEAAVYEQPGELLPVQLPQIPPEPPDEPPGYEPPVQHEASPEPAPTPEPPPAEEPEPPAYEPPAQQEPPPEPEPPAAAPPPATHIDFSVFSFYIPENAEAYALFYAARPDLDAETVVWKVNVSLHRPFYSIIRVNRDPSPLLINPFNRLPPGFAPADMTPVNNDDCFLLATPETVAAFRRMRAGAQAAELDLAVTSAFRTAARQEELWEQGGRRDGSIARPYHSEHQTGRALDLWGPGGLLDARDPSPTGIWVAENAHYYGFIVRYRAETTHITGYIHEPWHITYVGREISMYMHANNILSLEEFVGRNPGVTLPPPPPR